MPAVTTLTWVMGDLITTTSNQNVNGGQLSTPLTAIASEISNLTNWEIERQDRNNAGAGIGAIVLKPKANGNTGYPNQRIIIVGTATANSSMTTSYAQAQYNKTGAQNKGNLWIGLCKDVTGGTWAGWESDNPFGVSDTSLWSKYLLMSEWIHSTATAYFDRFMFIESEDGLGLFVRANNSNSSTPRWWGGVAGQLLTDAAGNHQPIVFSSGDDVIQTTFWGATNRFTSYVANSTGPCCVAWDGSAMATAERLTKMTITATTPLTTPDGDRVHLPAHYKDKDNGKYIGMLRQIRTGQDSLNRTAIVNGSSVTKSLLFCPTEGNTADALAFDQG